MLSRAIVLSLVTLFAGAQPLSACSIPVFRFALERWVPDLFEVSVFYRGTLSESDEQRMTQLEDQAVRNGGSLNLEVVRCNLDDEVPDDLLAVWKSLNDAPLPTVVVRTPRKATGQTIVWHGRLSDPFLDALATSPARREIAQRLLQGDSVVWLFVRGTDSEQAHRTRQMLDAAIKQTEDEIELPAGIGRPGSELRTNVPLHLKFSVVEVSAEARDERVLVKLLHSVLKKPLLAGDSCIAPIFGRGRVLDMLSARELESETISDLTQYLCGACSCQVKQQNPGFDLLCAMNWDEQLFDENVDPASLASASSKTALDEATADTEPTLVAIPSGHEPPAEEASPGPAQTASGRPFGLLLAMAALAVVLSLIVMVK